MNLRHRLDRLEATPRRVEGKDARERLAARLELARQHDPEVYACAVRAIQRIHERRGAP